MQLLVVNRLCTLCGIACGCGWRGMASGGCLLHSIRTHAARPVLRLGEGRLSSVGLLWLELGRVRAASGVTRILRGGRVCSSEVGSTRPSAIWRVSSVAHVAQHFRCAACGFSCPAIAAVVVPRSLLPCLIATALSTIRRGLIWHVVIALCGRRLLVLAWRLRGVVWGRCGLVCRVLLRRALLARVAVVIVVV
jgi:hypothetical protein